MRKKTKGFTVLELIITLSLTVVVLGVVYTFFFSNSKTLAKTEINSDLQLESETIQKELLLYGTQAEGISKLNNVTIKDTNKYNYEGLLDDNGKLEVEELRFKIGEEYFVFTYKKSDEKLDKKQLTLKKVNKDGDEVTDSKLGLPKILSSNVTEFEVRPLDYRMKPKGNFKETTGVEISLVLNKKKGYSDVTIPVSVIVKFRNK